MVIMVIMLMSVLIVSSCVAVSVFMTAVSVFMAAVSAFMVVFPTVTIISVSSPENTSVLMIFMILYEYCCTNSYLMLVVLTLLLRIC